ncbi:alanine racemase [Actinocatenispora thailandica]|uniref:Alanine racemase n=1 Tax=Actinocatenispora thailandica TaxID=227318 RepID=A0A7R7DUA5_9ACTN|nr:alanine racemase [Actinocatenispora thailandica]BCJ37820.1 alanine racemase [Actinocatenispora thailandica]
MEQAEAVIDLDAIASNVAQLGGLTSAEVMAVVKADGYGHGAVPAARAALRGGASWLGVATLPEAYQLRDAGITAPLLAWLIAPGTPVDAAVRRDVDLSCATLGGLADAAAAGRSAGRPARVHLKIDTGLSRGGATADRWLDLVTAAAKAQADGAVQVVGVWSHLACADEPGHPSVDRQLAAYHDALAVAERAGLRPTHRHLANSAGLLTRPDTHFDLVRPGIACYGLSPVRGWPAAAPLRPAMTVRARVLIGKRVPAGAGVSYGHTYRTERPSTLAVVPLGYADGVFRAASNAGQVWLGGARRTIAGRVCMDQFVVDLGDDPVADGDVAVLFGPGDDGEPTADDWADVVGTISYEVVCRLGVSRAVRRYVGGAS